jgi:hypothetical protein
MLPDFTSFRLMSGRFCLGGTAIMAAMVRSVDYDGESKGRENL